MAVVLVLTALALFPSVLHAGEVQVAAASNFLNPVREIAAAFERVTGHRVLVIGGSTGKLYAQIHHGAPFDVLLAADAARPKLLEEKGLAVKGTRFTYAVGRLTLWSPDPELVPADGRRLFQQMDFQYLAIANPKTAPYGLAALQVLKKTGAWEKVQPRLVQGENIGQTFQFVASGNAQLGFVALSQVLDPRNRIKGSHWDVDPKMHDPIEQQMVLLKQGQSNKAARAFTRYMHEPDAREIIQRYGYGLK